MMPVQSAPFKYQELKEYFIERIRQGKLQDNSRMPSEPELVKRYGLSRNTVRQAMKELENEGYLYRIRGRGTFVKTGRPEITKKIALVIFDTEYAIHPLVSKMIRGIGEVLSNNGYTLDILASHRSDLEADISKMAATYAGFIIGAWQIDKHIVKTLVQKQIPHIFAKNYFPGMQKNAVLIDFEKAGKLIVEHLAGLGHKNIALLYAGEKINISRDFKAGVFTACLDNGIRLHHENILDIGFTCDNAFNVVDFLCKSKDRVSAVITLDDDIAARVVQRLTQKGLSVPEDISVTGCNDMPVASLISPALTTLSIPIIELGKKSAEILLDRLRGQIVNFNGVKLSPELIIRESTCRQTTVQ